MQIGALMADSFDEDRIKKLLICPPFLRLGDVKLLV
jgi:hypothetical protein